MTTSDLSREQGIVRSGASGTPLNSARAGYLPIPLAHIPNAALRQIPVFLRSDQRWEAGHEEKGFTLYHAGDAAFTDDHRGRLTEHGVKFLYIRMADQSRFRRQVEDRLQEVVSDPAVAASEASEIVYETSVELMNELLSEPDLAAQSPRLESVSRAVSMFVMNDPKAFSHLFAAAHHDFYTATHMVNVATWMVTLAYQMGYQDSDTLNRICQAGMLHDIGKIRLSEEILNKKDRLSNEEWEQIRQHPQWGHDHLVQCEGIDRLALRVCLEHHEREDGSGYPAGLAGSEIDPISKICAVVDSFDAMTAFRPFKEATLSVSAAMAILEKETPTKYDPGVIEKWVGLVESMDREDLLPEPPVKSLKAEPQHPVAHGDAGQRRHRRFTFHCPARVQIMEACSTGWVPRPAIQVTAHSISRSGLGFLTQIRIQAGEHVRVHMDIRDWNRKYVEGRVVRCRAYQDGWFEVGISLVNLAELYKNRSSDVPTAPPPTAEPAATLAH